MGAGSTTGRGAAQEVGQAGAIGSGSPAREAATWRRATGVDQAERRRGGRELAGAGGVEDDGPAERGQLEERDRELAAVRRGLADDHAGGVARRASGGDQHGGERRAHHGVAREVALDRAARRLAREVVAERLDLDGVARSARELDRGRRRGRDGLAGDRYAVGGQQTLSRGRRPGAGRRRAW